MGEHKRKRGLKEYRQDLAGRLNLWTMRGEWDGGSENAKAKRPGDQESNQEQGPKRVAKRVTE